MTDNKRLMDFDEPDKLFGETPTPSTISDEKSLAAAMGGLRLSRSLSLEEDQVKRLETNTFLFETGYPNYSKTRKSAVEPHPHGNRFRPLNNGVQLQSRTYIPAADTQNQFFNSRSDVPCFTRQIGHYSDDIWSTVEDEQPYKMRNKDFRDYQTDHHYVPFLEACSSSTSMTSLKNIRQCQYRVQCLDHKGKLGLHRHENLIFSSSDACTGCFLKTHEKEKGKDLCDETASLFQSDGYDSWFASLDERSYLQNYDYPSCSLKKNLSVPEVAGRICLMAMDHKGYRLLQKKLSEGSPKIVKEIFYEVIDHLIKLATDPFGNYMVQKLLEVCDEGQLTHILKVFTRIPGDMVRMACDMHRTRPVQKLIEVVKTQEHKSMVVNSLNHGTVTMMKHTNGNHVSQRCLQYLGPAYSEFLVIAVVVNCVELATDRHGCCILQKCLSHPNAELKECLLFEIISNSFILSQDPFGNYVVQSIFELHMPKATAKIIAHLEGKFVELSMQKYSSNVVEKCLKYSGDDRRAGIIRELIDHPGFDQIMQHPYGNYVIQAALRESEGMIQQALLTAIQPHVSGLRTSPYGKKVLSSRRLK